MFKLPKNARQISVKDIVPFVDLLARWPYEPAVKIAYEYYNRNLKLHFIDSCFRSDGKDYAILEPIAEIEQSQSYTCGHMSRFAYLLEDIERIEAQNPLYTAEPVAGSVYDSDFDVYSPHNAAHLAAETLNVLQIIYWQFHPHFPDGRKTFPGGTAIKRWMTGTKIYNPEHCLPMPKGKWRVSPDQMIPIFRKAPLAIAHQEKQAVDFDLLNRLVAEKRGQGVHDEVELAFIILQAAPDIKNGTLASLVCNIKPQGEKEYEAARQRGRRLRNKVIKSHA